MGTPHIPAHARFRTQEGHDPLLLLSLLEDGPRHGYELSKLIEAQSGGVVRIHAATLHPLLYRLERQLSAQRATWGEFVRAISQITGVSHA